MRRLWNEFKSFAMSGNMLDLALGFIIGAAFAKIIESLANNVLMQLVAAIFGQPDFTELKIRVNGGEIKYGAFLTDLVNFLLLAALLFGVVKFIVFVGVGRGRAFGTQDCPYCQEQVAPTALVCRFCRQPLVDELPTLAQARERLDEQKKRKLPVPLPSLPLPNLPNMPNLPGFAGRRRTATDAESATAVALGADTVIAPDSAREVDGAREVDTAPEVDTAGEVDTASGVDTAPPSAPQSG